jgi:hypothetical protein
MLPFWEVDRRMSVKTDKLLHEISEKLDAIVALPVMIFILLALHVL